MSQKAPPPQIPPQVAPGALHLLCLPKEKLDFLLVPPDLSSIQSLLFQGDGFKYAHSFSIHNPLIAEQINIDTQRLSSALSWLHAHTMRGVEFSSAVRDPPPRCYPGTRETLLDQVKDWLENPRSQKKVFCLRGPAGVGKSALSQSLAECTIVDKIHYGASLFLDPAAGAYNDPSRLWTTISYRLATNQPSYALRIQQEILRDLKLVEQSMTHQFRSLIIEPIGRDRLLSESPCLVPIFIDGLDKYHQIRTQEQMIHTILGFVRAYPEAPLAWIIAFRPERHILKAFSQYTDLGELVDIIDLSISSEDARKDVQLFLRGEFSRIQDMYDVSRPWPLEEDFVRLFIAASGFFIFACAIICFCEDSDVGDPVDQLNIVFSSFAFNSEAPLNDVMSMDNDPLHSVHTMYEHILRHVQPKQFKTARRILGFLLLPNGFGSWTSDSTTFWSLCNVLGIDPHEAYACLSKFASILAIPARQDAAYVPIRFLHNSFAQYLAHEAVSKEFWIDVRQVVADLWHCHLRALTEASDLDSLLPDPSLIQMTWPLVSRDERKNSQFRIKFWENARRFFFHHLLPCPSHSCPSGPHYDSLSDSQDSSLLLSIFEKIQFDRLVDGYAFPDVPYRFIAFLDWLLQLKEDHPLRKKGFIDYFDVSQGWNYNGDLKLSGLAFKIHVEHRNNDGYIITFKSYANCQLQPPTGVDRSRLFSIREPPETISNLQQELDLHEQIVAVNMKGKCRVLVDSSIPEQKFYYILPLGKECGVIEHC